MLVNVSCSKSTSSTHTEPGSVDATVDSVRRELQSCLAASKHFVFPGPKELVVYSNSKHVIGTLSMTEMHTGNDNYILNPVNHVILDNHYPFFCEL